MLSSIKSYVNYKILLRRRMKLKCIKTEKDCVKFLKNYTTLDEMLQAISTLYLLEPPSEQELQILSILQQSYSNNLDIKGYATLTMWLSVVNYLTTFNLKRQKTWP
jgi:hypothetical protein